MPRKKKQAAIKKRAYYTHANNINGCLRNGSFIRRYDDGKMVQYMNGDCMGLIESLPKNMKFVATDYAESLIPDCCKLHN